MEYGNKNRMLNANDMFIRSIEEASFDVEVLSDMIYQKLLEE